MGARTSGAAAGQGRSLPSAGPGHAGAGSSSPELGDPIGYVVAGRPGVGDRQHGRNDGSDGDGPVAEVGVAQLVAVRGSSAVHPFTAPAVRPLTILRCTSRKKMTTGSDMIVQPAISPP